MILETVLKSLVKFQTKIQESCNFSLIHPNVCLISTRASTKKFKKSSQKTLYYRKWNLLAPRLKNSLYFRRWNLLALKLKKFLYFGKLNFLALIFSQKNAFLHFRKSYCRFFLFLLYKDFDIFHELLQSFFIFLIIFS